LHFNLFILSNLFILILLLIILLFILFYSFLFYFIQLIHSKLFILLHFKFFIFFLILLISVQSRQCKSTTQVQRTSSWFGEVPTFRAHCLPWGSIISGQRREFDTMMPLSMLKLSIGRPAICHARIFTGSPRVTLSENTEEQGIFLATQSWCHSATQFYKQFKWI